MARLIVVVLLLCYFFNSLIAQDSRFAISARVSEASMVYFVVPYSLGVTLGGNIEYRFLKEGFLGASHNYGFTGGYSLRFRIHDSDLYYFHNNPRFEYINQIGLKFTVCEAVTRKDYSTYGNRIHAWSILIGNNRIFVEDFSRLIFGFQFATIVSQKLYPQNKYPIPTSFLFLSLRYMLSSGGKVTSHPKTINE